MTPFMTRIGSPGQARCAARCLASGKRRNAPGGPIRATEGRALLTAGRVAHGLLCKHNRAAPALPAVKIAPVKGDIISAPRY